MVKRLVKNAQIITPYEILQGHVLAIEGGKIAGLYPQGDLPERDLDDVIDAQGNYLSPGFIDLHNHGNSGHDVMDSTSEALEAMAKFHAKNGVTSFLATTMTASFEDTLTAITNTAGYMASQEITPEKAEVLGLYLEGPYFSAGKKGAQTEEYLKNPNLEEIHEFIEASRGHVRILSLAPELPGAMEVISFLKNQGITVSAGHTEATFEVMREGIHRGITQVTHLFNGMRAFSHREPGPIGAALTDDRVVCELICDGVHLHPAAMKLALRAKGRDKVALISDAMMATGLTDGAYSLGGQDVIVKGREARLEDGTLAGSTLRLNKAVYNMVHMVGTTLTDAVYMASLVPARAIGVHHRKGSIEIGKDSDLIVFDDELKVHKVIR